MWIDFFLISKNDTCLSKTTYFCQKALVDVWIVFFGGGNDTCLLTMTYCCQIWRIFTEFTTPGVLHTTRGLHSIEYTLHDNQNNNMKLLDYESDMRNEYINYLWDCGCEKDVQRNLESNCGSLLPRSLSWGPFMQKVLVWKTKCEMRKW